MWIVLPVTGIILMVGFHLIMAVSSSLSTLTTRMTKLDDQIRWLRNDLYRTEKKTEHARNRIQERNNSAIAIGHAPPQNSKATVQQIPQSATANLHTATSNRLRGTTTNAKIAGGGGIVGLHAPSMDFQTFVSRVNQVDPAAVANLGKNCSTENQCEIVVCTAIYLEEPYLEEWINYHLLLGVQHFYLIQMSTLHLHSRLSINATRDLLQPYINRGQVTLGRFNSIWDAPALLEQIASIEQCIKSYKYRTKYMIDIDVDEFYYSETYPHLQSLTAHLSTTEFDAFPIPWYLFGSSGYEKRPKELTIKAYHRRTDELVHDGDSTRWFDRRNGKFVFKAECFKKLPNPHQLEVWPKCKKANWSEFDPTPYHIKHYQTKSWQDWTWKRHGNGFTGFRTIEARPYWNSVMRNWKGEFQRADAMFNDTSDSSMKVYWPIMEKVMNFIPKVRAWRWCVGYKKRPWAPMSCPEW
eukprot:TRINITY_DN3895_c0_g1_i1.p1 TRINITY_DN3895_c0_g1~~TRINITY_DN3895_c0_g1_i1.p1  ORF type:complete len:491 (-),score=8.86 TRINITY_DN3895_c0_g1_i1:18-1418(-)